MECDRLSLACVVCGSSATPKRCTRCRTVVYCSRDHQIKDWPSHKHDCKKSVGSKQKTLVTGARSQDEITINTNEPNDAVTSTVNSEVTCSAESKEFITSNGCNHDKNTKTESDDKRKVTIEDLDEDDDSDNENKTADVEYTKGTPDTKIDTKNKTDGEQNSKVDIDARNQNVDDDDHGIPFDVRPFKMTDFPKCPSKSAEQIAKFASENLIKNGYCVVDDIFEEDLLDQLLREIKTMDEMGLLKPGQLAGGRTSGDDKQKVTKSSIRNDRVAWIEGNEEDHPNMCTVVENMDMIVLMCNTHIAKTEQCLIQDRTKVMIACYPGNGTHYKRHVDNPNKDGRKLTCILYLNKNWNVETDGGVLRILPEGTDTYIDIPPVFNRMLFFWSDTRNPHEVHPAYKTRYAMTVWYYDHVERQKAKADEIVSETAVIQGEMTLKELESKVIQKKVLEIQIENHAMKAVNSLSEEELLGLAMMLKDQKDTKTVLDSIGIAGSIQKVLLKVLKDRNML